MCSLFYYKEICYDARSPERKKNRTHCCFSIATVVTEKCHNITWPILFFGGLLRYPVHNSDCICQIMSQDAEGNAGGSSCGTSQHLPPVEVAWFGVKTGTPSSSVQR